MNRKLLGGLFAAGLVLFFGSSTALDGASATKNTALFNDYKFGDQDALLVIDEHDRVLFAHNPERAMVPASVVKLFTAWLALDKWGAKHQFETEVYYVNQTLWVKGYGDPMLVSEELDLLVSKLQGIVRNNSDVMIKTIGVDSTIFKDIIIPGQGRTDDPYNAPNTAVAVNFNTVSVEIESGRLVSGEEQTPMTTTARNLGEAVRAKIPNNQALRINLQNSENAQRHFAEVLRAKLGLSLDTKIRIATVPADAKQLYVHSNSRNLSVVIKGMLEYSNNFIANQLFLMLADKHEQQAGFLKSSQDYASERLLQGLGMKKTFLTEGAGLSRDTRLTTRQILTVLDGLKDYQNLLKSYKVRAGANQFVAARAKSGTLSGVQTLAGYLQIEDREFRFVFLFNSEREYGFRERVLQSLTEDLSTTSLF